MLVTVHRENIAERERIKKALVKSLGVQSTAFDVKVVDLPNRKRSSELDFWRARSMYNFSAEVWCSQSKFKDEWVNLMLYFYDNGRSANGGFAVVIPGGSSIEGRPVKYYTWSACDHEYEQKTVGNCEHEYKCKHCDHKFLVDSSD